MDHHDEPLLLVLDYPGYRPEARFADLRLDGHGVRTHDLLRRPLPRVTDGSAYAARSLLANPAPAGPVTAIAAYCASAPLAFELARAVAPEGGAAPRLVLVDAEPGTLAPVLDSYRDALAQLGVHPSEEEVRERAAPDRLADDPRGFVDALVDDLERRAADALRALGSGPAEAVESAAHMAGAYADWLSHLVAAHRSRVSPWDGEVLHIDSAGGSGRHFAHGAADVREVRIDCDRKDLLRSEETREAVLSALR
ncbi:hypothetical protein [Streptomyces ochraceiscleroticus]|uniref:hypothetical protein n=1 Tax=Streptomyces ochraceiscleroticus TaxID=47761 RepID=UPI0004C8AA25|nr:hypothetical protein [Streptomyces ochraceiscleroticus]